MEMGSSISYSDVQATIARHWGFRELRPKQEEAIRANLLGKHLLVVLPTGGGKSLCFQAPAACRAEQITIVISPLIALMKDQVDSLNANGVPACYINSSLTQDERDDRIEAMRNGDVRLVYIAPERLVMEEFLHFLQSLPIASFAIDEAHCISHWGHDFRPEYRQMALLREWFPGVPIHAFTATATEKVRLDIIEQLQLDDPTVLIGDFHRPNLNYRVAARESEWSQCKSFLEDHRGQAGIIYCLSRANVDELVADINNWGFSAMGYHAGMDAMKRKKVQEAFRNERCNLIVATVAFGMGIDRPDVRFVLHMTMPKSLEHYQQESGRAGRDGLDAECVLLYHRGDAIKWSKMLTRSAEESEGDKSWLPVALEHINEMDRYCKRTICRHRQLVNHFGQDFSKDQCGACDVCLGDAEAVADSVVVAQKLLSAIARCDERFGAKHLIEVLRGENSENVRKHQHEQLSVFGLMKEHHKDELRDWYEQLASLELLRKEEFTWERPTGGTAVGYILKLNAESWKVLRKQRSDVKLWKKKVAEPLRRSRRRRRALVTSDMAVDAGLFTELQKLRRHLAGIRGVAPYVICHDTTLNGLASVRPSTRQGLLAIPGFGQTKVNNFGTTFLQCIKEYCEAKRLEMDVGSTKPVAASPPPAKTGAVGRKDAWPMFERGRTVIEVAAAMNRATSTVQRYLEEYLQAHPRPSPEPWLHRKDAVRIREFVGTMPDQRLKPIHEHFRGEFTFEQLRVALAWRVE